VRKDSSHYNNGNRLFFFKITAQGLLKRGNANVEKPSRAGFRKRKHQVEVSMTTKPSSIPAEQAQEIRRLSHDLSNALEIIVQANYLLGAMSHDESAKEWVKLLDNGVVQAAGINRSLREYIVANS
jgi:hypothetical protein